MSATQYKLDNLCAVIDRNRLQISGTTEEVMHQDSVEERFAAFGWNVLSVDGNDIDAMNAAFDAAKDVKGKPTLIVANTTKGKGSSVMENKASWHHHVPSAEEYEQIMKDLKAHEEAAQSVRPEGGLSLQAQQSKTQAKPLTERSEREGARI